MKVRFRRVSVAFCIMLAGALPLRAHEGHDHTEEPTRNVPAVAYAISITDIKIDGALDDWPKDAPRYRLLNFWDPYGPADLTAKSAADAEKDCGASFRVGYDADKDLIHLAVTVIDEDHLPQNPDPEGWPPECDACEIYLDGFHAERTRPWLEREGAASLASIQYVGVAGANAAYVGCPGYNLLKQNPAMHPADIKTTATQFAWKRDGNVTTYEWSVQAYDRFPTPTDLKPGLRIGFDVIIVDLDRHDGKLTDHAAWTPFGARGPWKFRDASSLADLVLLAPGVKLGTISGRVIDRPTDTLHREAELQLRQGPMPAGQIFCAPDGNFSVSLPAGKYALRAAPKPGMLSADLDVTVESGKSQEIVLLVEPKDDPQAKTRGPIVRALIDGSDVLKIKSKQVWYEHRHYSLPGTWVKDDDDSGNEPTYINGKAWLPKWNDKKSEPFIADAPLLPENKGIQVQAIVAEGRGAARVIEQPSDQNDQTLSVLIDDDDESGAQWYTVRLRWP